MIYSFKFKCLVYLNSQVFQESNGITPDFLISNVEKNFLEVESLPQEQLFVIQVSWKNWKLEESKWKLKNETFLNLKVFQIKNLNYHFVHNCDLLN